MFVGIAISLTADLLSFASPVALFANGEIGAWYDPSDLTTLFQDSAGTTPVTAPNQTVGKMLDKSGRGNHATQATSTQRPIYGINPIVGTRNLLTFTEQFNNAPWSKFGTVTVTPNDTVAPDGTTTADKVAISTSSGIFQAVTALPLTTYTASVWVRADSNVTSRLVVNTNLGDAVLLTINATTTWQRVSLSKTTIAGTNIVSLQVDGGNGANTIYLWGAQIELGSTATAYQPIYNTYGPYVNGASQTGGSLVIDGASPDETGYLLAGDYIQLGTGSSSRLHKVLTNVDTDSSGNATLDIWPHIRVAPADNAAVTVSDAKGLFRLSSNDQGFSINESAIYGMTFGAMEAV